MAKCVLLFWIAWLSACAHQSKPPLQIHGLDQLPALAAEFETLVTATEGQGDQTVQRYRWRFWRASNYIETKNLEDHTGEIWKKSANDQISYEQVFHAQRQAIDYFPGDLSVIGVELDWSALATLVNPSMLANLVADEPEIVLGRSAQRYQSLDNELGLELCWLEHEQIPASIKFIDHGHKVETRLLAIYPLAQSPWSYQQTADFRHTDFADLGDKENDPVIKLMAEHNRFRALAH